MRDAGAAEDEDAGSDRQVSVGAGNKRSMNEAGAGGHAAMSSGGKSAAASGGAGAPAAHAGGAGGAVSHAGAGGEAHHDAMAAGGTGGDGSNMDDGDDDDKDKGPEPMGGAGGGSAARDPLGVLWDLARQTPQGMGADAIRKYLESLNSGDTPASTIEDFLHSVDDEAHCKQGISAECLAACQVVARTCAVCLVDDDCRKTLLDVCGVAACR